MTIQELIAYAKNGRSFIDVTSGNIYDVFDIGEKCIVLNTSTFKSIRKENSHKYQPYNEPFVERIENQP